VIFSTQAQKMTDFMISSEAIIWKAGVIPENGLPVIEIETENGAEITSKEDYLSMTFALTDPDNPSNNISKTDMKDLIRGRGHDSWTNPNAKKKSYRIKFDKKTSLFGLEAAKSWVLLAQYRDATLLYNVIAFELGNRFAFPFNHSFHFVELYLNGEYKGNYLLTEQNQVNPGRVDIDENTGWLVEIDGYYDKEPKFRTINYRLPVMIKSPEIEPYDISNPAYNFVRNDLNVLTNSVASANFPESGYRNLINMDTFIDFLIITEICDNKEIETPMSTFMYKDKCGLINMGPLWDFDCGYGYNYSYVHYLSPETRTPMNIFFEKLFEDPIFLAKYKKRWNEKYADILSMTYFMDEMARKLEKSAEQNFQTWWYRTYPPWTNTHPFEPNDFLNSISLLKNWYQAHVSYLNTEINKIPDITGSGEILHLNPLKAWVRNGLLHVSGLTAGETLNIFNVTGSLVYQSIVTSDETDISLNVHGVYLVQSGNHTIKVAFY